MNSPVAKYEGTAASLHSWAIPSQGRGGLSNVSNAVQVVFFPLIRGLEFPEQYSEPKKEDQFLTYYQS